MKKVIKILFLIICFFAFQSGYNQLSKTHYIPPLTWTQQSSNPSSDYNRPEDQYFYISTPSLTPVNYTIKRGSDPTIYLSGTVDNTQSVGIKSGPDETDGYLFVYKNDTQQKLTTAGFIIEADREIYVSVRFNANLVTNPGGGFRNVHAGALVSKGDAALGTKFRTAGAQTNSSQYINFGSVMATENNTQVTITAPNGQNFLAPVPGPIIISLDKGESYIVASQDGINGSTGTLIESDKPVVVNSGGIGTVSQSGDPGGRAGGYDWGVDQIVSAEKTGNEYIFVRGGGRDSWENVFLLVDQDNTEIFVNGSLVGTSNAGELFIIEGNLYSSNGTMHVKSGRDDDKIFAYQFIGDVWTGGGAPAARQSMIFVPPLDCGAKGGVNKIAQINKVGKDMENGVVSFVTKKGATISIFDGNGNVAFPTALDVPGTDYVAYIVNNLTGDVLVEGNDELYISYYNYDNASTTGSFYSGFQTSPQVEASATFESLGPCIKIDENGNIKSNVKFSARNGDAFDGGLEWQIFDDATNSYVPAPGVYDQNEYEPNQEGRYRLKGLLLCKNQEYYSNSVRVNICAGDFDDDGILDNIDLDIDNDGILNSFESRGKGIINFTNLANPVVTLEPSPGFPNSTTINNLITGSITKGTYDPTNGNTTTDNSAPHTLTGYNDSRFESQVLTGVNQFLEYKLDFSSKVNVKIQDDPSVSTAVINGETFIIQTRNSDESITLLDPDDNLLIYSETDDVFEYGVNEYTAGDIKFKFNPSSTTNTYQFTAFEVEGITIMHQNTNTTSNSVFVPVVELYDFAIDTDGDSVNDLMQLDSDGDGCFDVIEAGYLDEDSDGIYGEDPNPNIADGTVDEKGRINDADYDYTIEPRKDANGQFYFQKVSTSPQIDIPPKSTIACYEGADAEFEVIVDTNDTPVYLWQVSSDNGTTWTDLENDGPYSGVDSAKLMISPTTLSMDGYLFRVKINTDEYACYIYSDNDTKLSVEPILPIANTIDDITKCDDDSFGDNEDGIVSGWNLNAKIDEIRTGNAIVTNLVVTFHTSLNSANDLNDDGISNSDDYTNEDSPNEQIIFVRVRNTETDCYNADTSFKIVVEPLPTANAVTITRQCDGGAGDDSQDGLYPFDTSNIQETLLNGQLNVITEYQYVDENGDTVTAAELPNPFISGSQIVTIKVENDTPQKCYDETTLEFIVDDSPETYAVVIDSQCDDGVDDTDGYSEFDTSTITQTLLTNPDTNQTQSLDDFSVEYEYVDVNGATVTVAQLPNPFNINTQTVKATVTNKLNGTCVISEDIQFTVNKLPVVKEDLIKIEQCDPGEGVFNDGVTLHDLTESQLLFSDNYENEIFKYYEDSDLLIEILDPTKFENDPFEDEVWVKIISEDGCERISKTQIGTDRLKIDITVGASEISETFMQDENTFYTVCDDSPATEQDGISIFSSTVLKEVRDKLIASNVKFDDQNIRVTLHTNSDDGLTGQDPINLNLDFTNVTPNTQEIWARIVNIDITEFTCLGYAQVAELYVEPRPVAYPVTIDRQCDGGAGDDSQDGIYPFDTTNIVTTLLTNPDTDVIQDESILTITYFNEDGTEIDAADFAPVFTTASQTITIRVERDPSYPNITNPDGLCYDETTLEFIVDDTPEINPVVIAPHCDGDDGNDDRDGFDLFDTSTLTADLLGRDQSLDDYEISYLYTDENGNLLSAPQLRNPFNTQTQTVTVTLTNKLNTTCPATTTIDFVVNPLPEFTVDDARIVCLNFPPIPIGVVSSEGDYSYTWTHTNNAGVNNVFPPNNPDSDDNSSILVGEGGIYYVTATTTDGTDCSRTLSIEIDESEIATVTQDDITVQDLTSDNNNTITIDTANLGIGDYEFAIDDPNGPYQNDPFFENVRPGIHTIYIRDRNDCGIAQIDVSIIGYKKFFTPNSDGIHDTWRILGIREDFQPNSRVYIFDRYGKLIKELDPVTEGWDGTYLGRPMPQTDYWFRVFLEDGREFKGHFSLIRGR